MRLKSKESQKKKMKTYDLQERSLKDIPVGGVFIIEVLNLAGDDPDYWAMQKITDHMALRLPYMELFHYINERRSVVYTYMILPIKGKDGEDVSD